MITVSTLVAAPLEAVWRAYTTPADICVWNTASPDWHTPRAEVDLRPGGAFIVKVMRNGQENAFTALVKPHFDSVKTFKPKASRQDSAEIYLVATGFRPSNR